MSRALAYAAFAAVTALVVAGALRGYGARDDATSEQAGELVLPAFASRINESALVAGVDEDGAFTLARRDGKWVVVEKGNYPAEGARIRELLVGLAQLKVLERKTAKPERYAKLGLAEPGTEGSRARSYVVKDAQSNVIASLIVGETRPARGEPNLSELYVRKPDNVQTWAALGLLPNVVDVQDWLDDELLELDDQRIRVVKVRFGDGEVVTVQRMAGAGQGYRLLGVPDGREVDNEYVVRNVATTLARLTLDDVGAAADVAFEGDEPIAFKLITYDGLQIAIDTVKVADDRRIRISAARVESAAVPEAASASEREEDKVIVLPADEVEREIVMLNQRWDGYVFEIGDWRLAPSYKRLAELLKPLPEANSGDDAPAVPDTNSGT